MSATAPTLTPSRNAHAAGAPSRRGMMPALKARPRDQIGRSDEVEKLGGAEPPSFLDDLPLHQGQMSSRSAEAEAAELEKEGGERSEVGPDSLAHRFRLREARKSRSV